MIFYFLFLSDEGPMLETLDYTIRIGSTPTFLYFGLLYGFFKVAVRQKTVSDFWGLTWLPTVSWKVKQCKFQPQKLPMDISEKDETKVRHWITFRVSSPLSSCCRLRSDKDCFHYLTAALHSSLCCENDVHESVLISLIFRFLLMGSLNRRRGRPLFLWPEGSWE